jgi:hypothetical protein
MTRTIDFIIDAEAYRAAKVDADTLTAHDRDRARRIVSLWEAEVAEFLDHGIDVTAPGQRYTGRRARTCSSWPSAGGPRTRSWTISSANAGRDRERPGRRPGARDRGHHMLLTVKQAAERLSVSPALVYMLPCSFASLGTAHLRAAT